MPAALQQILQVGKYALNLMKTSKISSHPLHYYRGVSAVELMMVLAVIGIMIVIAAPALRPVTARAEIKSAAHEISQAIRVAKNTARVGSQPVTVTITTGDSGNSISFAFSNGTDTSASGVKLPTIVLPDKISVAATQTAVLFDPMGIIVNFDEASDIVLTSTRDSSEALTVSIINELGYITIAMGVTP